MSRVHERFIIVFCVLVAGGFACAQNPPSAPDHPWDASQAKTQLKLTARPSTAALDPAKVYVLSELVNIAEENNPETRVAWQNAKARAADLGIAKSTLYPTVAAEVLAGTTREGIFFGNSFQRQTVESYSPVLELDYVIFDFGRRTADIAISRNNLLAANLQFNDTHRAVIFGVMQTYYHLLDTKGLQEAAEANLKNAQTVDQAAEARLQLGLATLPDVLEARSAAAQADYNLQAAIGAAEIAHGDLATALGISPTVAFQVETIQSLKMPDNIGDSVEASIDKALGQRPDLLQRVADLRATSAAVRQTQRDFLPTLSIDGNAGMVRAYGEQITLPGVYSPTINPWNAQLTLSWTLFDGLAREKRLQRAQADQKQAAAAVDSMRDQVENQVWAAYSTARTALRQQKAAAALLEAANESYNAALESYNYGVRSQIDVVSAQRTLADARTADVTARTQLLTAMAALSYQTADLLYAKTP